MKVLRVRMRSFAVEDVVEALQRANFEGMTLSEIQDHDSSRGRESSYRGAPAGRLPTMKMELMLAVHDDRVEALLEALRSSGCNEDLSVVIDDLEHVVRIRTGQIDEAAL